MAKPADPARALGAGVATTAALLLFGLGLVAPLTPSERAPTLGTLLMFVVLPLALLGIGGQLVPAKGFRVAMGLLALTVLAVTLWLLSLA